MDGVREESLLSRDTPRGGQCVVASFDNIRHDVILKKVAERVNDDYVMAIGTPVTRRPHKMLFW